MSGENIITSKLDIHLRKKGLKALKFLLLAVVLYFVAQNILINIDQIKNYQFNPDYRFLVPAIIVWIITNLYPAAAWRKLISMLGGKLSLPSAMRIFFTANIGRYIPGGIWVLAGLVVMAQKAGVSRRISMQGMIYSQVISNLLGVALILIMLGNRVFPIWILVTILLSGIVFLSPKLFSTIINFLLKLAKREPLEQQLTFKELGYYFFLQTVNWLLIGLTFFLFLRAFVPVSLIDNPELLIIMPACWTAAFLMLIAPGGLGLRETLLLTLLTPIIGTAPAIVLPWLHRIIQTVIELLLAAIFNLRRGIM